MKGLLHPKMDFVFKNIFGSEKNPIDLPIGFLYLLYVKFSTFI